MLISLDASIAATIVGMVDYRRVYVEGGTYFFTLTLRDRASQVLLTHIDALGMAFRLTRETHPFETLAIVVLPDHLHTIWTLPLGDNNYAQRWRMIKSRFTLALKEEGVSPWQRRYWEHAIRDESDLQQHIDYIHFNPVKHGYVNTVADWPHSSFHQFVKRGSLDKDWGVTTIFTEQDWGE
jgi:putative transposase